MPARQRTAVAGRFVVPGFVDAHVHLDKAYLLERAPSREGTLAEAIRVTAPRSSEASPSRTSRPGPALLLDRAIRAGRRRCAATWRSIRSWVCGGWRPCCRCGFEHLWHRSRSSAAARSRRKGIIQAPGTEALLRDALRAGADVVLRGAPTTTPTARHTSIGCRPGLASSIRTRISTPTFRTSRSTVTWRRSSTVTERHGWQGRVAVGHLTELAAL